MNDDYKKFSVDLEYYTRELAREVAEHKSAMQTQMMMGKHSYDAYNKLMARRRLIETLKKL